MSARDMFFKKVIQNKMLLRSEGPVEADIRAFCQQMDELAQQVTQWLDGTGIEIVCALKYLSDLSTVGASLNSGTSRYVITTIRLLNGSRSVSIFPERVYQPGKKGCVTMMVDAPSGKQQFYLSMAPGGGWFILGEHQTTELCVIMTEEVFFQAIERLA